MAGFTKNHDGVSKISFCPKKHADRRASIVARLMARPTGAWRREGEKPRLFVCLGDTFELITVCDPNAERLSVRIWRPASDGTWMKTRPDSSKDAADFGLTSDDGVAVRVGLTSA